jgi:hypothetical protein
MSIETNTKKSGKTMSDHFIYEKQIFHLEEAALIFLLVLSLIGIGITDFSPSDGFGYWLVMVLVFAVTAFFIAWRQSKNRPDNFQRLLYDQALHWPTNLLVVGGFFLVEQSGRVLLLILSLATMLDGLRVGWRFNLVGLFLGIAAVVAAYYKSHFLWLELLIAIVIVVISVLWEVWKLKQAK